MHKILFIYNSSSGDNPVTGYFDQIISLYQEKGYCISMYKLCFDFRDASLLSSSATSYEYLLIAGGDGSINYVVNILKKASIDIPVAIIPAGTANDFASMLGMPMNIMDSCRAILNGEMRSVDLGIVNGHYFVNVFSCGLFTDISQKTPTIWKNNLGKIAYYINGIGEIPKFRKMELSVKTDGGNYEGKALILFVFNGQTAGTLPLAYLSEGDDGLLDVLILKGDTPLDTLRTAIEYLPHRLQNKSYPKGIEHIRCSTLHAESLTDEHTDMDGQPGPRFPIDILCDHNGLKVIGPKKE